MPFVEPTLESPETIIGMFQRGLGAGHLAALDAPEDARSALDSYLEVDCVRCCDRQLDERERYIAEIAADVGWLAGGLIKRVSAELAADPDADGFEYQVLMLPGSEADGD